MAPRLILRSWPGDPIPAGVLRAAGPILDAAPSRRVAYVSAASLADHYLELNHRQWAGVGEIEHLDVETASAREAGTALRRAALLYIPGGNTYVLAHRLRVAGLFVLIRDRLAAGLPFIGVSAGAVLCGRSVLLSNDVNGPGLTEFAGFGLVPVTINVHDPIDDEGRAVRDERIAAYRQYHDEPVLAIHDGAEVRVDGDAVMLVEGTARLFRPGAPAAEVLEPGPIRL